MKMIKGKEKRFMASFLSLVMLVNMQPANVLTVYADPETHVHCVCGSDSSCGDAHDAATEWTTAWDTATALPTAAGSYYLTTDVSLDNDYEAADGVFLCLNGHTVDMNGYMYSCEGSLTITNCSEEGGFVEHNKNPNNYYLLNVRNLTMYNINISVEGCTYYGNYTLAGYSGGSDSNRSVYYLENCDLSVTDNNNEYDDVCGIRLEHTDKVTIKASSVNIDTQQSAYGIYISNANDTVTITDTQVIVRFNDIYHRDYSGRNALRIYSNMSEGTSLTATDCTFYAETENSIETGGVYINSGCDYEFTGCKLGAKSIGNSDTYGFQSGYTYGTVEFSDCTVSGNKGGKNIGYCYGINSGDTSISVTNGSVITGEGYGIYFNPSNVEYPLMLKVYDSEVSGGLYGIRQYAYSAVASADILNSDISATGSINNSEPEKGSAVDIASGSVYIGGASTLTGTSCGLYSTSMLNPVYFHSMDGTQYTIADGQYMYFYGRGGLTAGDVVVTEGMTEDLVGKVVLINPELYYIGSDGKAVKKTTYRISSTSSSYFPGCDSYGSYKDPEHTRTIWETYEGKKIYITASPKTHYVFDKWIVTGATLDEADTVADNSFTTGTSNIELTPTFAEAPHWTVTYNSGALANNANRTVTDSKYAEEDLTLRGSIFERTGYTQTGWSLTDNGPIAYALGAVYTTDADATLYPHWEGNHTITIKYGDYPPEGHTADEVVETHSKKVGIAYSFTSNYRNTFKQREDTNGLLWRCNGFSVNSDGSTQDYDFYNKSYDEDEDITLYPYWERVYIVRYHGDEYASNADEEIEDQTFNKDASVKLKGSIEYGTGRHVGIYTSNREWFNQGGWAETPGGEKVYDLAQTIRENRDIDLYPYWEPIYWVKYLPGEDGISIDGNNEISYKKYYGTEQAIKGAMFVRPGYTQVRWTTEGGTVYRFNGSYSGNDYLTLYPVWEKNAVITYMPDEHCNIQTAVYDTKYPGVSIKIRGDVFSAEGYELKGYTTTEGSEYVNYYAGNTYSSEDDLTLYPVWDVETYALWVGNIQVTAANKGDVINNGKVSFDPVTSTLTLDAASVETSSKISFGAEGNIGAGIIASSSTEFNGATVADHPLTALNIVLNGNSSIDPVYDGDCLYRYGIVANGLPLCFGGTGSLTIGEASKANNRIDIAIDSSASYDSQYALKVNGPTLRFYAHYSGIYMEYMSKRGIVLDSGSVDITVQDDGGYGLYIRAEEEYTIGLTVRDGELNIETEGNISTDQGYTSYPACIYLNTYESDGALFEGGSVNLENSGSSGYGILINGYYRDYGNVGEDGGAAAAAEDNISEDPGYAFGGDNYFGAGFEAGSVTIKAVTASIADENEITAGNYKTVMLGEDIVVNAGENEAGAAVVNDYETNSASYKYAAVSGGNVPAYLYVGNTAVTADNLSGEGWAYVPATNTLTLNSAGISDVYTDEYTYGIYTENDLKLVLTGNSSIGYGTTLPDTGIYVGGSLIISGSGSLDAVGKYEAIDCKGSVSVTGGSVDLKGNTAISAYSSFTLTAGRVKAVTGNEFGYGIRTYQDVIINGGELTVTAGDYGISATGDVIIKDGKVSVTAEEIAVSCDAYTQNGGEVSLISSCEEEQRAFNYGYALNPDGDITINGGSLYTEAKYTCISTSDSSYSSTLTLNGGTLKAFPRALISYSTKATPTIRFGYVTVNGGRLEAKGSNHCIYAKSNSYYPTVKIYGGSILLDVSEAEKTYKNYAINGSINVNMRSSVYRIRKDGDYKQKINSSSYSINCMSESEEYPNGYDYLEVSGIQLVSYRPDAGASGDAEDVIKAIGTPMELKGAIYTKEGYVQSGWALREGGAKAYELKEIYDSNADLILYPVWDEATQITYNPGSAIETTIYNDDVPLNGSTVLRDRTYTRNAAVQTGWNTDVNGNGDHYELKGNVNVAGSMTLYPEWSSTVTLSYDKGRAGKGENSSSDIGVGAEVTLAGAVYTRTGFVQIGWAVSDGGDKVYDLSAKAAFTEDTTLYPAWSRQYTISYKPGTAAETTEYSNSYYEGTEITLKGITYTADRSIQIGWNTDVDSRWNEFSLSQKIYVRSDLTLYPVFERKITLSYDKGSNGNGNNVSEEIAAGNDVTLKAAIFTREGYTQTGWSKTDGGNKDYFLSVQTSFDKDTTLYPYWEKINDPGPVHQHTLVHHERVEATATTAGNTEYWECSGCHKLYSDANATTEITAADTLIPASGGEDPDPNPDPNPNPNPEPQPNPDPAPQPDPVPVTGTVLYEINVIAGASAKNSAGKEVRTAKENESITISWTGKNDYEFVKWELTGAVPGDAGAKTTTFTMPAQDVNVEYTEKLTIADQVNEELPKEADTSVKVSALKFKESKLTLQKNGEPYTNTLLSKAAAGAELPEVYYVTDNADIVAVDKQGKFYATGIGETTVTAYCGNKKASCKVTVVCYTASISLLNDKLEDVSDKTIEMTGGEQAFLKVSFDPFDSTDSRNVKWKSDNKKITVKNGIITAKEVKETVSAKVTATVKYTDPKSGKISDMSRTVTVNLKPADVAKASSADKSHKLKLAKSRLALNISDADKAEAELAININAKSNASDIKILSVESTNDKVVCVNSVSAVKAEGKKGSATIRLKAQAAGSAYIVVKTSGADGKENVQRCKVTVSSPAKALTVKSGTLKVNNKTMTLRKGVSGTIEAALDPAYSTDMGKLKISGKGITVKNGIITVKKLTKAGKPATITVKCGKLTETISVTITK